MAGYLLALAALILVPLARVIAPVADALLGLLITVTRLSAALPVTSIRIGRYTLPLILAHAGVILAASGLSRMSLSKCRLLPLCLVAIAGLASLNTWLNCLPFRVTFLDAGSADCAVLTTLGRVYVFDAGDTYTPAADYLSATALRVDGVFLSHPHQDHAGGLDDILDCFRPDCIYVPKGWFEQEGISQAVTSGMERAADMGIPIVELSAGDALELSPAAHLDVYNPDGDFDSVNDMSLLLRVESDDHSVLFTGDLTSAGEPDVVPDCDVLKVAHHGADNATSGDFLAAAMPEIAVISVGENSHGHPGELTLWRLSQYGIDVLRTDERGAITLSPDGDGWHIKTFLEAEHGLE